MSKCIICGSNNYKIIFNEFGVDILKCLNCGHIFSSFEQEQYYGGYYGEKIKNEDHFWWDEAHKKMYDDFCRIFIKNKSGKLLDVGCGFGYFIKKISFFPDWEAFGYEISETAVNYARNNLGLKNIFSGRVENSGFPEKYFDIITLWDVVEHIPNPKPLLVYLRTILKEDGILFIHTPNAKIQLIKAKAKKLIKGMREGAHYLEAKDHINIYSSWAIKEVLRQAGFKEVKFVHLHPIQSISGSKNSLLKIMKNLWFYFSVFLFKLTFRKVNADNLFVIAKKS
jgi:2-polyprenyl-3-methyl-5-hydroxy-6-metoxy-1,4-benzoquinol methylase